MSRYRYTGPLTLSSGTNNMTGVAVITSLPLDLKTLPRAAFMMNWTGSASGTFSVQGSIDGVLYADLGISIPAVAGVAGNTIIDVGYTGVDYVEVIYTNTGGTGSLTIKGSAKT